MVWLAGPWAGSPFEEKCVILRMDGKMVAHRLVSKRLSRCLQRLFQGTLGPPFAQYSNRDAFKRKHLKRQIQQRREKAHVSSRKAIRSKVINVSQGNPELRDITVAGDWCCVVVNI